MTARSGDRRLELSAQFVTRRALLRTLGAAAISSVAVSAACDTPTSQPAKPTTPATIPAKAASPSPSPVAAVEPGPAQSRILIEAEDMASTDGGWRPIRVGEGNYMVDAIGASHVSGQMLLHAPASAIGTRAAAVRTVPRAGRYKLWARYEFPYRDYHTAFTVRVEQPRRPAIAHEFGARDAVRSWFFTLPDAAWNDLPHGVEGLVAESTVVDLAAGQATVTLEATTSDGAPANRNVDCLLFTADLDDTFRGRGAKPYPILDEIGAAAGGRCFLRVTNLADSGESFHLECRYSINRVPWSLPQFLIDRNGVTSQNRVQRLQPGDSTPWIDVSCRDTTHPAHLHINQVNGSGVRRTSMVVDVAYAPSDQAILRKIVHRDPAAARMLLNLPPYPAKEPRAIETGEETLERIVASLGSMPPPAGKPPRRTLLYGGLGDDGERNLASPARLNQLYRRLFFSLGLNAFSRLGTGAFPAEQEALRSEGRDPGRWLMLGDYRWPPTEANIAKAKRDVDAAQARAQLRGFSYGDEIQLEHWTPRDNRDIAFRQFARARGLQPSDLVPGVDQSMSLDDQWRAVRFVDRPRASGASPRAFVESRRWMASAALRELAEQSSKLRAEFGEQVVYGANYSPHPSFWPSQALWVDAFRRRAVNRASHDDYWWQASELGPQMTGYLLDVFRAGLRGTTGVVQPYVMPHSPGNTDADLRRGVYCALIHGAKALDFFQITPEQANTENYIQAGDLSRFRALRDICHEIGAVDDVIADGVARPARVGIVLSESSDLWEQARPPEGPESADLSNNLFNAERKFIWSALRHAHVPVDFITEDDLVSGAATGLEVLYLSADHLRRDAAAALDAWVVAGGHLVATGGLGTRDEHDEPSAALLPTLGLGGVRGERFDSFIRPRVELPRLAARDTISTSGNGAIPALGVVQRLEPAAGAEILGRFADGSIAGLTSRRGQGRATAWGSLIGAAYIRSGFPDPLPPPDRGPFMHTPLGLFDASIRRLLTGPAEGLPRSWPWSDDPLVELGLLEAGRRLLIIAVNLAAAPRAVTLHVPLAAGSRDVRSVTRGPLPFQSSGQELRFRLDLEVADFVIVDRS